MSWSISGTYVESCNCDVICPCRRVDGVSGGRSTHGVCVGVLSWLIEQGEADGLDLAGLPVAMAIRYDDDEPGSPWTWILYLDERASQEQRAALEAIFSGERGGDALQHFPWAWKPSVHHATRTVAIYVSHRRERGWLRVRDRINLRIASTYPGADVVTCVIPGHDRSGTELVADELVIDDGPLAISYRGNCGYAATFDYAG